MASTALHPGLAVKLAAAQGIAYGQHGLGGDAPGGRAQRRRPGRQLGHYGLRRYVDEDVLPVDPRGLEERQARLANPPAVAVVGSGWVAGRAVPAGERLRTVW